MSRKRCIRKHYTTAPGFNPILHAILGAAITDKESSDKLLLRELSALESITHGTGSEQDWRDLVDVVNLCAEAMRMGIGREAYDACKQAKESLEEAAHRYKATGRMGLTGAGIQAIRDTIEYHDLQRRSIARSQYELIIKKTADRVRSNRPHGVSA